MDAELSPACSPERGSGQMVPDALQAAGVGGVRGV